MAQQRGDPRLRSDKKSEVFSQKQELIKSVAASQAHLSVHDLGAHSSHRDLDQRARPSERGGRVDDIEALENIDLLRDKIFQRL